MSLQKYIELVIFGVVCDRFDFVSGDIGFFLSKIPLIQIIII